MRLVTARSHDPDGVYDAYWDALRDADERAALRALEEGLSLGRSAESLVREVIAEGQHEIGRRWEAGEIAVAPEHAATAIAEQGLAILRRPRRQAGGGGRRVALACPEGEWHTFPARVAADLAERVGVEVISVGGSCPAEHLGVFLRQVRPDALALSVTMSVNLVGAWKAIQAAHLVGVPVIAGGAAWGPGATRSERLGADMRVEDPADLARALNLVASGRPLRTGVPMPAELEHLSGWSGRHATAAEVDGFLVRAAAAAIACDDTTVLDDMCAWLTRDPASGGMGQDVLRSVAARLADRLAPEAPLAAALLGGLA